MAHQDSAKDKPGNFAFAAIFVAFSLFLLSRLTAETQYSGSGNLVAQPRFWPGIGVAGMAAFGLGHLAATRRFPIALEAPESLAWIRALEYLAWFMAYVAAAAAIGYLPSTLLFTLLLSCRQGYRDRRQLAFAALLGIGVVLIFKTGLGVKIPGGAAYEYLPDSIRSFMILNF